MSNQISDKFPIELIQRLAEGHNPAYGVDDSYDPDFDCEELITSLSQRVLGLAVENAALKAATDDHYYWEDGGDAPESPDSFAFGSELKVGEEFDLMTGVEIGYTRFRVVNDDYDTEIVNTPLETPVTDAAIAEFKAQGVDDAAECFKDASVMSIERNQNMYDGLKKFSATLRAGGKS